MRRTILVVDDEESIRSTLTGVLEDEGFDVVVASHGREALDRLKKTRADLVLLDIWMPDLDGLETLKAIRELWPDQTVVMMSGHGTIETAVKSTKLGAYDFIEKPLSIERLLVAIQNALSAQELVRENQALRKQVQKSRVLVGQSPAIVQIRELVKRVAPTTGSVLITGENGTGKEVVAQLIHATSTRSSKPFIEVNCAAIPEELIESELFGHEKGAFTGAVQQRRGRFDLAHSGTLFLDEIGDMSLKTQAKILRILQEQKFERVGGSQSQTVDVRIIAATNKDLKAEIKAGRFREDLYYRLNVVPIHLPPLRDRKSDVPLLAEYFLKEYSVAHSRSVRSASEACLKALAEYPWPGNVRELRNLIERIMILTLEDQEGSPISAAEVLQHLGQANGLAVEVDSLQTGKSLRDARHEFEKEFILKTLKEMGWNVSKTAAVLGIERSHLHKKMKTFGIEEES